MERIPGLIIGLIAVLGAFIVMIKVFGQPVPEYPKGIVTELPAAGEWVRPEADAKALAEKLSVEELIDRWNYWPQDPGNEGLHLVYAEALAIYEEEAVSAVPHLAKAVTHLNPNLRKSVMNALASIGEEGVPPLVKALELWPPKDPNKRAVNIRWDAAEHLTKAARNGVDISAALPALRKCLLNPANSSFTRQHAATALSLLGTPEAQDALEEAQDWFYDQDGLSVEENRVLKRINNGLRLINQPEAP